MSFDAGGEPRKTESLIHKPDSPCWRNFPSDSAWQLPGLEAEELPACHPGSNGWRRTFFQCRFVIERIDLTHTSRAKISGITRFGALAA